MKAAFVSKINRVSFCCSLCIYFSCVSYVYKTLHFLNINLTQWRKLILYFENYDFWRHHEFGSGLVTKIDPLTAL